VAELGGKVIPYPYASTTSLNTPAFEQAMSFLTSTLTNEHLIAPGAETGPNANGDNLPEQPHQAPEAGLGARAVARISPVPEDPGLGRLVWPAIKSLDPLFEQYWAKQGIDMSPFLTEAHGKVVNFPVSSGMGAALLQIENDLGPAWLGSKSVSSALGQAGKDANYALKTGN
jgi:hypothetical protein